MLLKEEEAIYLAMTHTINEKCKPFIGLHKVLDHQMMKQTEIFNEEISRSK